MLGIARQFCVDHTQWDRLTGGDAARSGDDVNDYEESWMQTTVNVQTEGSLTFWWKVSSQSNSDWLEFYIDAARQDRISGTVDWQQKGELKGSGTFSGVAWWRQPLLQLPCFPIVVGGGRGIMDCGWEKSAEIEI